MGFLDDIGDFFSDVPVVGPVVSGLFGMAAADKGAGYAQDLQDSANLNSALQSKVAYDRSMEAYKSRYQNTMADMRAAGLNPILAASGGFNVGNAPTVAPAQTFMQSYVPNYAASAKDVGEVISGATEAGLNIARKGQVEADIKRLNQDVAESIDRAFKLRAEANLVTAQESEAVQRVQESLKRIDVMSSEIFKLNQEVRESVSRESLNYSSRALADSNIELNKVKEAELRSLIGKVGQETRNLYYESFRLKKESEVYGGPAGSAVSYAEKIGKALPGVGVLIPRAGRFTTKGGR